jgi:chemotaxis receptor (MCP) glutamine deamidase CheD
MQLIIDFGLVGEGEGEAEGEAEAEGETSYRNLDFTPATEIIKRQRKLMINDRNFKVKLSKIQKESLMLLSIHSDETSYRNLDFTPATEIIKRRTILN